MPIEGQSNKNDSNFKIIALIAVFLLISLVAVLFYFQNYKNGSNENSSDSTTTSTSSNSNSGSDTVTANGKTTYTSKSHGYSVTYPESWTKEGQSAEGSSGEIVLLNLKDREKRDNGKPNIIIYAGATIDFCNAPEEANLCKEETITVNGSEVKKFTSNETDDVYYDMGGGILFFTRANGDQRAIDDVVQSFRKI